MRALNPPYKREGGGPPGIIFEIPAGSLVRGYTNFCITWS